MLSADIRIVDIDGAHWGHWYETLVPPRLRRDFHVAVIFLEHGVPMKAVVRGRGAVALEDVPFAGTSRSALARVALALDVPLVLAVERAVLSGVARAIERDIAPGDDFVAQLLAAVRAVERSRGAGIWSEPPVLELIPPLSYEALQRTFDVLIADQTSVVAYVFDDDGADVYASLIAVKRRGDLDLVTTHQGLEQALPAARLARDWRRQSRQLLRLIGDRYDKPSLAIFLERATLQRILVGPPDQLAREINLGNVILDPAPAWLLGLLGSATMAAVAGRGAKALASMLPPRARKMATNLAQTAQTVMRESGAHPFALLGFDPIELWHQLRGLYHT